MHVRLQVSLTIVIALLPATALAFSSPEASSSSGSSGNNGSNRRDNDAIRRPSNKFSSQLASQVSATPRKDQDAIRARRRNKRSASAPLVDSTLLRFISEQKKKQQQQNDEFAERFNLDLERQANSNNNNNDDDDDDQCTVMMGAMTGSPPLFDDPDQQMAELNELQGEGIFDPWMGQYNRHRIAQKLMCMDVDKQTAMEAGERVQSLFLARTARRRVREFLRERDVMWTGAGPVSTTMPTISTVGDPSAVANAKEIPHPDYTFDDVVNVMLEYGFTGKDIGAILSHSPSLALMMPRRSFAAAALTNGYADEIAQEADGEVLEDTIQRSFTGLLMKTLKLRRYDARKVMRGCPGLLSMRGSKSALQVVAMMTRIGVSTASIARDKAALPALLSRSPAGLFRFIAFLSSDAVRMPTKGIGPLIRRPESLELLDAVAPIPRIKALQETDDPVDFDFDIKNAWEKSAEQRKERVNEVFKNMTSTAWTLRNEIGTEDLGKVVAAYPSVLLLDATEQILPMAAYLMDELGIMEGDLPRVLQLFPALLGRNVEEMKEIVAFFESLDIDEDTLASMFRAFPALLTLNIDTQMAPVVDFLLSIGINDVGRFVARLPPILGYSVENDLEPKWKYLNGVRMYAGFEVAKFPAYFSYPFERVIRTRYEYLALKGHLTSLIPIDAIVRFGDKDFATQVARDDDGGESFKQFSERRKQKLTMALKRRREQQKAKKA